MTCATCHTLPRFCSYCCCAGVDAPAVTTANRPGLANLRYRIGTHGSINAAMHARIAALAIRIGDGQGAWTTVRPLQGLSTRATTDPAIALLDGWACVADVLTFYQERFANEGYLRTATERRSVLELARLVGYALRPGVAASVYLAYTINPAQGETAFIAAGSMAQSVPGPDETPQTFETSEDLLARASWNDLGVRRTVPQFVTLGNVLATAALYVQGADLALARGDQLLLTFAAAPQGAGPVSVVRRVDTVDGDFAHGRSRIALQGVPAPTLVAVPLLRGLIAGLTALYVPGAGAIWRAVEEAQGLLDQAWLGLYADPLTWYSAILGSESGLSGDALALVQAFADAVAAAIKNLPGPAAPTVTDPSEFVHALLVPRIPQAANALQLPRNLQDSFRSGADAHAQLLLRFAPQLRDTFYTAWEQANVNAAQAELISIAVLSPGLPLFGAAAQKLPTYTDKHELEDPDKWRDWTLDVTEAPDMAYLEQAAPGIVPGTWAVVEIASAYSTNLERQVVRVTAATTLQRTAYNLSAKTTRLQVAPDWWYGQQAGMDKLRATLVYAAGAMLALTEAPLDPLVQGQDIPLASLHKELAPGRWVVLSGERADIAGVTGVPASELMMVSNLVHDVDRSLPGDTIHTTLHLATPTAYAYRRDTLVIQANVVKATHGETRRETLGSGTGAALQRFTLRQPPLTYVAAPTSAGAASTLQVLVDDVAWNEVTTLAGATPKQRSFVTKTGDDQRTTVIFGNGDQGARAPSGVENIKAVYRQGIGAPGNVRAGQISLLLSRPLGVDAVINPLRASGGADREDIGQARENAPLAVTALDRLVSRQDYADFTRTFAGIGKASSRQLSDGRRQIVHLTIAGVDDAPIDSDSDLYRNLLLALYRLGDPAVPVQVQLRELVVLVVAAGIALAPGYQWESVATRVRTALLGQMGFAARDLGQPALLCEVVALIQNTDGVGWVNVTAFGGIPSMRGDSEGGPRRMLTMDEIAATVEEIQAPAPRVPAGAAGLEGGVLRPAGLAIFSSAVADTIILNQIKSPS